MTKKKPSLTTALFPLFAGLALALLALCVPAYNAHAASIRYAAPTAQGSGDCSSWENACTLQTALTGASSGDEIWVKAGVHLPTSGTDRTVSFALKDGVAVYGGFAGTETAREQRNWIANLTTLSGDIGTAGNNADNTYHVVTASGITTTAVLDGFTIRDGYADGDYLNFYDRGGGMYNYSSSPSLANITFSNNTASHGGGMYNSYNSPSLANVTFSNNTASYGGGMVNSYSSPNLVNVTFSGNTANYGGGMYSNDSSSPSLLNVTFSGNTALSSGGGMVIGPGSTSLVNVTFSGNTANHDGGGMVNSGSTSLANVTFSSNTANQGGGMYNYSYSSSTSLVDVTFSGNTAEFGGGMYNTSSSPSLANVTFSNNTATNRGGGMYNDSSSPSLVDITFSNNTATNIGGGMYSRYSSPSLENITFSGNTAEYGGGMYNASSSSPSLTNVTFSGNTADYGGGMNNGSSSPSLANVILWGNSGGNLSNNNSTPVVAYSDIQGCGGSGAWNTACGTDGGGNIDADPLFAGAPGNLRLVFGSPAIDTGTNSGCPATDLVGHTRPLDGNSDGSAICDMGAYETYYRSGYLIFLPTINNQR